MGLFDWLKGQRSKDSMETDVLEGIFPTPDIEDDEDRIIHENPTDDFIAYSSSGISTRNFFTTTDDTLKQKDANIRRAFKEFSKAFRFCHYIPLETLAVDPEIVAVEADEDKVARNAIVDWLNIFEADPRQESMKDLNISIAEYYRTYGEVFLESRFLVDEFLPLMDFKSGMMLKRIHVIPPWWVPRTADSVVRDQNEELIQLRIKKEDGGEELIKPPEIKRFIHEKNRPCAEDRGISYIKTNLRGFGVEQDLWNVTYDTYDNHVRPFVHYKILRKPEGLPPIGEREWQETKRKIKAQIIANRGRVLKSLISDERIELVVIGAANKSLDPFNVLRLAERANLKNSLQPDLFVAEDVNRATADEIRRAFHRIHAQGIDFRIVKRIWEKHIFPTVLMTYGMDIKLAPKLVFPPFQIPQERLLTAQAEEIEVNVFGEGHRERLMEEKGIKTPIVTITEEATT